MGEQHGPVPAAASFEVGRYDDGSGFMQVVRYDTSSEYCPTSIWIDGGDLSQQWIAFDYRIAEEMISAIRSAAQAIDARQPKDTPHG